MPIAILDPFSGIAGDMTLGALVDLGLDPEWLRSLPGRLGLDGVTVRIRTVDRAGIACKQVEFDIPPQPHGRHLKQIREIVARSSAPDAVRDRADAVFLAIATCEGEIHGVSPEKVHLHEVGAVDAILDVLGAVWGLELLGVTQVYCGALSVGDGFVRAAHGMLPVPAPATLKLLEGLEVRPGPDGAGELVTPTGAGLVRVLSKGRPPASYIPVRSGYGAGSRNPAGRANALRIILATPGTGGTEGVEQLVVLVTDIDDMAGEYLAGAAELLRDAGALDVTLMATSMKKGRPGHRLEVLARREDADRLEDLLFTQSTSIGVRRLPVERRALPRRHGSVMVLGHEIGMKVATLPSGGDRAKPEYDDVRRVARETGRSESEILALAQRAGEQV